MIKACIFDMDGLLIDSERCMWSPSMNIAAAKQGFELTEEFHNSFRGMNSVSVGQLMNEHFGNRFDYDLFLKDVQENNKQYIEKGLPLRPGALELLHYLKDNNIYTCIGTSTIRSETDKIISAIGIGDFFDAIVCGDEIKYGKPNPDIYLACLAKFGDVNKSEALVFEDGQAGGEASIAAGIRLVLVPDLAILSGELKSKAFKVIDSLDLIISEIGKENNL